MPRRINNDAGYIDTPAARRDRLTVAIGITANQWIREEARLRGWRLVSTTLPTAVIPRGALVGSLPDSDEVKELQSVRCSLVRLGKLPHPDDDKLPAVLPDQMAQGRMAAEHFAERDFRDVAYCGQIPWGDAKPLFEGLRERAEELGMSCHLQEVEIGRGRRTDDVKRQKHGEFISWISELPKPVGLLAAGDFRAAMFCDWAREAGLRLPEDVAILSRGNRNEICECSLPTISSIDLNEEGLARAACELLAKLMEGEPPPPEAIMIPPAGIVERESTSVLATSDTAVGAALRYIWDNLDLDISVDDISKASGLSTRQLKRRFRKALNRGINEELRRKRLEEAKKLLRTTNLSISEICPLVGFRSTTYMHRTFKAAFGNTPAQYRQSSG